MLSGHLTVLVSSARLSLGGQREIVVAFRESRCCVQEYKWQHSQDLSYFVLDSEDSGGHCLGRARINYDLRAICGLLGL